MASALGCSGEVKRRNLMPVGVWKQVRRKREDSRDSMPVVGGLRAPGWGLALGWRWEGSGAMVREMAWMPWKVPEGVERVRKLRAGGVWARQGGGYRRG